MALNKNIHMIERTIRVLVGLGILSLLFWGPKSWWALLGLIPVVTGLIGYCPPYSLLGINTCGMKKAPDKAE